MKIAVTILIGIIAVATFAQVYFTTKESHSLQASLNSTNEKLEKLNTENGSLKAEIGYFSRPENLVKELKKKFNYRESDEKLMIIVP